MKALSINQPFGWAILQGGKDVENRSWSTSFRGEFLIHVGLRVQTETFDFVCCESGVETLPQAAFKTGGIIGKATLVDVVTASDSPWFVGPFGFVLADVTALPFQPCKGALGFFTPDFNSIYARDRAAKGER
ncbi:ASCH domain-containing protein [Litorimonas sp. WD9-15]|uniref:ASCH domain-containing protein n=1 Tax=Litorimonas sp. WD9-15 TaxID=3418716 RepID=UPI003D0536D2